MPKHQEILGDAGRAKTIFGLNFHATNGIIFYYFRLFSSFFICPHEKLGVLGETDLLP